MSSLILLHCSAVFGLFTKPCPRCKFTPHTPLHSTSEHKHSEHAEHQFPVSADCTALYSEVASSYSDILERLLEYVSSSNVSYTY